MKVFVPQDPQPQLPDELGKHTRERLEARYPWQFRKAFCDRKREIPNVYIEPGWAALVERVCEKVAAIVPNEGHRHFSWLQIKEKYARLRMHFEPGPTYVDFYLDDRIETYLTRSKKAGRLGNSAAARIQRVVHAAGVLSRSMCQKCGALGQLRVQDRWYVTLCDEHFDLSRQPKVRTEG